jgi:hypothetical protein
MAVNVQGFAMLGDLKIVRPEPLLIDKTNVQDNNQKPTDACPARTTAAMLLKMKITTSCPNIAKPHVVLNLR